MIPWGLALFRGANCESQANSPMLQALIVPACAVAARSGMSAAIERQGSMDVRR
jgi:hypothetical protein